MTALAFRQLVHGRRLAFAGVAGVTASLLLMLALNAIFAGIEQRLTVLLTRSGADVVIAQRDVTTMHMSESAIPASVTDAASRDPGVGNASGFLYAPSLVRHDTHSGLVYLLGQRSEDETLLGVASGERPDPGQIVIDRSLADRIDVRIGDDVSVLDRTFEVSGMFEGTASIANSVAVVDQQDMETMLRAPGIVSYVFVTATSGTDTAQLARRLTRHIDNVTATPMDAFVRSERQVVSDMATGIVRAITIVSMIIGIAVTALISSLGTHRQLHDIAVLRAIGATRTHIAKLVLAQVMLVCAIATVSSVLLLAILSQTLPRIIDTLLLTVHASDMLLAVGAVTVFAAAGSLIPLVQSMRVDPASAFHQGSST